MSNDPFRLRRRRRRRRIPTAQHRRRHLELVTDGWIAELADLAVLPSRAHRAADGRRAKVVPIGDRDRRPDSLPLGPA
jgi:hypothetical protein